MNLLFRLLWVLLRARFAARHTPLTAPSVLKFRVWLTDQDMFLHMTNSRYLSFSDLGRINLFRRAGLSKALKAKGWKTEICGQTMTINRMLKAPQPFLLETQIHGWDDEFLVLGQRFLRKSKNHAGVVTLLALKDKSGASVAPQDLLDQIVPGSQSPELSSELAELVENTKRARGSSQK